MSAPYLLGSLVLSPWLSHGRIDGTMWELPNELMVLVMAHLDNNEDKRNMRLVCRHWRSAVDESIHRLSGNMYWTSDAHMRAAVLFPNVARVDLSLCSAVTDLSPLASLHALAAVDLNWCTGLRPDALAALGALPRLTQLDLSGCHEAVTDEGAQHLAGLADILTWLSLNGCAKLGASGLAALAACRRLRHLDLSGTAVVGLHPLAGLCALVRLRLAGCAALGDGALHCLAALPDLAELDLSHNDELLKPVLLEDLSRLPGLRKLDLEDCDGLDDAKVPALTRLTRLRRLNVVECAQLSEAGLASLLARMPAACRVFHGCW